MVGPFEGRLSLCEFTAIPFVCGLVLFSRCGEAIVDLLGGFDWVVRRRNGRRSSPCVLSGWAHSYGGRYWAGSFGRKFVAGRSRSVWVRMSSNRESAMVIGLGRTCCKRDYGGRLGWV